MDDNTRLYEQVESLPAEVMPQGGVILDGLAFTSEAQVKKVVMRECPKGDAFEVFLDPMLLWCWDLGYSPVTNWEKTTRAMDEDYSATTRKMVISYYQTHCWWWYAEGRPVMTVKVMAVFKGVDKWNGSSGTDGQRHKIETSATNLGGDCNVGD